MLSNLKKGFTVLIVLLLGLTLSSCGPDLGEFDDLDFYKESLGAVTLMKQDLDLQTYDFYPDLFYEEITEDMYGAMPMGTYSYMFIKAKKDFNIEEMYLYFLGETSTFLTVEFSVVGDIPLNLRKYDDPRTHIEEIDGEEVEVETEYDEPAFLTTSTAKISPKWESVGFSFGTPVVVNSGNFLVFRFKNNTAYGKEAELSSVSFQTTGLFIRAIE